MWPMFYIAQDSQSGFGTYLKEGKDRHTTIRGAKLMCDRPFAHCRRSRASQWPHGLSSISLSKLLQREARLKTLLTL